MPKDFYFSVLVFMVVCEFLVVSLWYSVFAKTTSGFSFLVSSVVLVFSAFVLFGFWFLFDLSGN